MRITSLKKPMMIAKDDWVASALTDDQMVVSILLRLKHAGTVDSEKSITANLPLLRWGYRKRRSLPSRLDVGCYLKDSARASPMTPLCWSGGSGSGGSSTSPSAVTVDGFEYTSRHASSSTYAGSRSKVLHTTNEITRSCFKRSNKKKTFLELKGAENLQLKERLNLEEKIENVQETYKERNWKNQSLKRIKLERVKNNLKDSLKRRRLPSSVSLVKNEQHISESYRARSETKSFVEKSFFFLPDLNMKPIEEEDEILYGTS